MKGFTLDKNQIFVQDTKHQVSFPAIGHANLIEIENNSFWFKHRNEIIKKAVQRFPFKGDLVDIGGGNGYQITSLSKMNTNYKNILIEPGYDGCLTAKRRGMELVFNSVFEEVDFEEFDIKGVTLFDVVEHIKNDVTFLQNLLHKLPKGARIYITLPAHNYLWSDVDPYGGHYRRYNKKMVKELAMQLDVELEFFTYFFSYLTPISYLLRALPYKLGRRKSNEQLVADEKNQHNPQGITKKIFDFLEKKELKKINTASISFGASCLCILKKN